MELLLLEEQLLHVFCLTNSPVTRQRLPLEIGIDSLILMNPVVICLAMDVKPFRLAGMG